MKAYIKEEAKLMLSLHGIALAVCGAIALVSTAVEAAPWVDVHLASKHSQPAYYTEGKRKEYNEVNLGLGIEQPLTAHISFVAGGYHNSYNRTSLYTGGDVHTHSRALTGVGVMAGVISGYEETDVMVLPYYRVGNQNVRVKFGVIPGKVLVATVTAGFRF